MKKDDFTEAYSREHPYVNCLGQEFIPLPGMRGVLMGRCDVRIKDFSAFAQSTGYVQKGGVNVFRVKRGENGGYQWLFELDQNASWEKPGFEQAEDHPVAGISWNDAHEFCTWLSKKEGFRYRLPTDEEWSAAVGHDSYPCSDGTDHDIVGNYAGKEFSEQLPRQFWITAYDYSDGYPRTSPVSTFKESRNGFYDLGGNVWQWCEDWFDDTIRSRNNENSRDPKNGHTYRILRGGSWSTYGVYPMRASYRLADPPNFRRSDYGFRCVLAAGSGGRSQEK